MPLQITNLTSTTVLCTVSLSGSNLQVDYQSNVFTSVEAEHPWETSGPFREKLLFQLPHFSGWTVAATGFTSYPPTGGPVGVQRQFDSASQFETVEVSATQSGTTHTNTIYLKAVPKGALPDPP